MLKAPIHSFFFLSRSFSFRTTLGTGLARNSLFGRLLSTCLPPRRSDTRRQLNSRFFATDGGLSIFVHDYRLGPRQWRSPQRASSFYMTGDFERMKGLVEEATGVAAQKAVLISICPSAKCEGGDRGVTLRTELFPRDEHIT